MKKHFRLISALLAACMSLTMVAGAANIAEDDDEVMTGTAHIVETDGSVTDVPFSFTAPADASEEELDELVLSAANAAAFGGVQTRASGDRYRIYKERYVEIPKKRSNALGYQMECDPIPCDPDRILVRLKDVTDCSTVNVSISNDSYPNNKVYQGNIEISGTRDDIVFFRNMPYGQDVNKLNEGDVITVGISGDVAGEAGLVYIYTYEI